MLISPLAQLHLWGALRISLRWLALSEDRLHDRHHIILKHLRFLCHSELVLLHLLLLIVLNDSHYSLWRRLNSIATIGITVLLLSRSSGTIVITLVPNVISFELDWSLGCLSRDYSCVASCCHLGGRLLTVGAGARVRLNWSLIEKVRHLLLLLNWAAKVLVHIRIT